MSESELLPKHVSSPRVNVESHGSLDDNWVSDKNPRILLGAVLPDLLGPFPSKNFHHLSLILCLLK